MDSRSFKSPRNVEWYLPPECFDLSKTQFIPSKYEQNRSREINGQRVEFRSKPAVSNEAKELIHRCLTYNQSERPDVLTIAQDPYLSYAKR